MTTRRRGAELGRPSVGKPYAELPIGAAATDRASLRRRNRTRNGARRATSASTRSVGSEQQLRTLADLDLAGMIAG